MSSAKGRFAAIFAGVTMAAAIASVPSMAWAADQNYTPAHVDNAYPHYQPPYPDAAQLNGEQGVVTVDVQVSSSGQVRRARLETSSGFDDLDNAALEGVMGWHFVPAVKDGDTITDWTAVKIVFQLPTQPAAVTPASAPAH